MPEINLYEDPSQIKSHAEREYEFFKQLYPHLSEEQLRSMALSGAGARGRLASIQNIYPNYTNRIE